MKSRGFSLIEIMVTIGLFAILVSMGLILSMDVWRGTSIQNEQDIVLSLLYKARSRSLANINESAHGFYIEESDEDDERRYWVFEGNSFDPENPGEAHDFEMSSTVEFEGDNEIVFNALDARTMTGDGYSFTMSGQGKTRVFTINNEGGILWENE